MTTHSFTSSTMLLATLTLTSVLLPARDVIAQVAPPPGSNPAQTAPDHHARLAAFLTALARRNHVQIMLDPAMDIPAGITMPDKTVSLQNALNQVTRQIKNAAWQRVSLKPNAGLPSPEKLSAAARAMTRLPQTELVVENPPKERGTLLLSLPHIQKQDTQAETDLRDVKPIYLLYNTALPADGKTASERMIDMQRRQLQLMTQLPPEQRPNPALLGQRVLQRLSHTGQEAALLAVGEAGMAAWQNTAPGSRDEMIQQFMATVQSSPPPKSGTGANIETGATALKNYANTLRDIAERLAKRYRVRILIDPDLYVPVLPACPSEEMTLAQALEALTKSVSGSAWRGVYQKLPTASSASLSAKNLSVVVRILETLPPDLLRLENLVSQQRVALQTDLAAISLREKLMAYSFAARPVYLVYSTQDEGESSLPAAQRLEQMQLRQMDQLLRLNSSQMTQVMADALAQYSGGAGDTQSQMMRLPVMALMMGTWFPQKAKEDKATTPLPF